MNFLGSVVIDVEHAEKTQEIRRNFRKDFATLLRAFHFDMHHRRLSLTPASDVVEPIPQWSSSPRRRIVSGMVGLRPNQNGPRLVKNLSTAGTSRH